MEFAIVPMTAAHLDQVEALENICFPRDPWSRRIFEDSLANENTSALIAQAPDGSLLGYLFFTVVLDEGGVDNIATAPGARRQGVGRALMEAFHRRAAAMGAAYLLLEVRPSNTGAAALYEKLGYQIVGRRKNYYEHPKEDAIIMRLESAQCN